ncbi:hypothetical protein [Streptomyces sp. NPDC088812]|uniref:hypothetical protein n=1 Tax=Streptomyces sp. NPDC088812 TaxID=3365905 RepID=UPI0038257AD0
MRAHSGKRATALGSLLLAVGVVLTPVTLQQASAATPSTPHAGVSTVVASPWDYRRGFRDGFRDGYADARDDCRREKAKKYAFSNDDYTRGYADGYSSGYARAERRYC